MSAHLSTDQKTQLILLMLGQKDSIDRGLLTITLL